MTVSSTFLLLLLQLASLVHPQNVQPGKCGELGNCDYLVTVSIFQVGTCGRAARCYWELLHLKKALKGETANISLYESKIHEALCSLPTYKLHKKITPEKDWYKIFESGMPEKESIFDDYPMPTQYFNNEKEGTRTVLPEIVTCKNLESECTLQLDEEVDALCVLAITPENIKKIQNNMNLKVRDKIAYQVFPDIAASPDHNKCSLRILASQVIESGPNKGKFEDHYIYNQIYPRLRPPYFDLYLLYMLDPLGNLAALPAKDRWWNETKAYPELAHYLPVPMVNSMHSAIKYIYDLRKYDRGQSHGMQLVWHPEKFCWSLSTFVCVDMEWLNQKKASC